MADGLLTGFATGDDAGFWAPDNFAGAGPAESVVQLADSLKRAGEGDFAEIGMNFAAAGLDVLSAAIDPLGTLATAGIGWLIEHISFLREPLDWLAGNSDKIKAAVATWNKAALELDRIAQDQHNAVETQVSGWEQGAADRFRASQGRLVGETLAMSRACVGVAEQVATAGTITAAVRGMIRDLIAMFIWEVIRNAVIALASSWVSFGSSLAAFAAWTVGRAAVLLGKITKQLAKLMRLVMRIAGRLKGLFAKVGDMLKGLARFGKGGRGAGGVTRAADAPAAPRFQGLDDAAKRMEDWGNSRPSLADAGNKAKEGFREFGTGYRDAGNTWNKMTERATLPGANQYQGAADAYAPFKPITRPDGTSVSPHSVPDVMGGGFQTKMGADILRETSKQDELESEGVPKEQRGTFKRMTGHLDG
ncbi:MULTISPECIES: WXG100 family type VII secretion target [unclassified Saccharothrix]|uniref:WXG100 family type VII secretion target n=1 Tax=unclassified Saccharothrix TaxID=2593673 RepID=UPI00307D25C7